jgi:hypothetical protein
MSAAGAAEVCGRIRSRCALFQTGGGGRACGRYLSALAHAGHNVGRGARGEPLPRQLHVL